MKLHSIGPSLRFVNSPKYSSGPGIVSVDVVSSTIWAAAVMSDNGACYYIKDNAKKGTTYGSGHKCTGAVAAIKATNPAW